MATYPSLYHHNATTTIHTPFIESDTLPTDPTLRSPQEGGYVITRTRFTRTPRTWAIRYDSLSVGNLATLIAFEEAQGVGGEYFTWVHPDTTLYPSSLTVRFATPISATPVEYTAHSRYNVSFTLEEV